MIVGSYWLNPATASQQDQTWLHTQHAIMQHSHTVHRNTHKNAGFIVFKWAVSESVEQWQDKVFLCVLCAISLKSITRFGKYVQHVTLCMCVWWCMCISISYGGFFFSTTALAWQQFVEYGICYSMNVFKITIHLVIHVTIKSCILPKQGNPRRPKLYDLLSRVQKCLVVFSCIIALNYAHVCMCGIHMNLSHIQVFVVYFSRETTIKINLRLHYVHLSIVSVLYLYVAGCVRERWEG